MFFFFYFLSELKLFSNHTNFSNSIFSQNYCYIALHSTELLCNARDSEEGSAVDRPISVFYQD